MHFSCTILLSFTGTALRVRNVASAGTNAAARFSIANILKEADRKCNLQMPQPIDKGCIFTTAGHRLTQEDQIPPLQCPPLSALQQQQQEWASTQTVAQSTLKTID
jgi:hypothetical protein